MYREIIIPSQSDFTIHLPDEMIGKQVEIIAFNLDESSHIDSSKKSSRKEIDEFYSNYNIDMTGFKFNREEANER